MMIGRIRAIMRMLRCRHVFEEIERSGHVATLDCPFCGRRKIRVD